MKLSSRLVPAALLIVAAAAAAQPPAPPSPPRPGGAASAAPAIATIGARRVTRAELEDRVGQRTAQYRERTGSDLPAEVLPSVRRQLLETLIRRELLVLEAGRRGMLGSDAEAEAELRKDRFFNPGGRFDAARYEAIRTGQPEGFAAAMQQMREQVGARRLTAELERRFGLDDAAARTAAERSLARNEFRYLGLATAEFDGRYPEPRESEVLEHYRRHAADWRRPERATVTFVPVNSPRLSGAAAISPAAQDAWNARMRAAADSLVAALRAGGSLDSAASRFGIQRNVVVTRTNFPGFWQGQPADVAALFGAAPGAVVGPVRGRVGWLVARVEAVRPEHTAPLAEVSRDIRARLRAEALARRDERAQRALYDRIADSLSGPAVRVRWAWVDTSRLAVPAPATADLERYLRAHLSDYSYFDPATASVRVRPLAEVEADVRARWLSERREDLARATLDAIAAAWRRGRRDAAAERRATGVGEAGPLPPGAPLGDTPTARAVADSVAARGTGAGIGAGRGPEGGFVFQIHGAVPSHRPTFEQAAPQLAERLARTRAAEEERGARELYERDPLRFALGPVVRFSRLVIPAPDLLNVPLSREEVERYHRQHLDRYSAPEEVVARHILLAGGDRGTAADDSAHARAREVLRRLEAGEPFSTLAARYSDDAATRAAGGDLGTFGRGVMVEAVERAAFGAAPGEVVGPVRSDAGWHVVQVTERLPAVSHPLPVLWTLVGSDAAREKADRLNARRADSVFAAARTPAQFRELARRLDLRIQRLEYESGDTRGLPELRQVLEGLARMKPGEVYPSAFPVRGVGYAIAWVDSIAPPRPPRWETASDRALDLYRRGGNRRALDAKRAELDSMSRAGWSLDSLGTLWGGLGTVVHARGGSGLPVLGGAAILDSLAGDGVRPPALGPGVETGWIEFPAGLARLRLEAREAPDPRDVANRAETLRRAAYERKLAGYYEELKRRWPVRILDARLAQVPLPPLPDTD